jgi:hypothetical protein
VKIDAKAIAGAVALQLVVLVVVGYLVRSSPALRRLVSGGEGCGCSGSQANTPYGM